MKKHDYPPLTINLLQQFNSTILDCITNMRTLYPKTKDSQRKFTHSQKEIMLNRQQNTCNTFDAKACAFYITLENSEADHIIKHSNYGDTTLSNGQMLCINCHKKKTSKGL